MVSSFGHGIGFVPRFGVKTLFFGATLNWMILCCSMLDTLYVAHDTKILHEPKHEDVIDPNAKAKEDVECHSDNGSDLTLVTVDSD